MNNSCKKCIGHGLAVLDDGTIYIAGENEDGESMLASFKISGNTLTLHEQILTTSTT